MNVRRSLLSGAALAAVATLGAGLLTACSTAGATPAGTEKFDVVASFYPMAFLAERIGGDHVNVTTLTEPGQEPHDLEISARQRARLEVSDAALYLKGLQPSVDDAVGQTDLRTKIDAASLTRLRDQRGTGHADGGGRSGAHAPDPHVWLDPVKYAQIAEGVARAFEKGDPAHAADYRRNAEALTLRLKALDRRFAEGLKHTRTKVVLTQHASFGYLADRYGLRQEAVAGTDPEGEPSPARIRELRDEARTDAVTTVFHETLVSDRAAKTLASEAGLRTAVLDPVEGITGASRGRDYFAVMEANLTALRSALGAR
ncbi:ABC-transporter metal-binding lipoprotein [Streptomyces zinciresistens K42]|uniref:ABC-transporter metal-binding lipoprotein n=1 Tax=Streptomyces zinciresistens K42 TaxID=700597 RepID=G2GK24_9ACTN|nr:metal ABC transporter substrate-binding protein [Streptomyces zinciresistens]EGX56141.1 ABC-transporter metal-binding lipoprotein [Streptomyces zinciresistens K42]